MDCKQTSCFSGCWSLQKLFTPEKNQIIPGSTEYPIFFRSFFAFQAVLLGHGCQNLSPCVSSTSSIGDALSVPASCGGLPTLIPFAKVRIPLLGSSNTLSCSCWINSSTWRSQDACRIPSCWPQHRSLRCVYPCYVSQPLQS